LSISLGHSNSLYADRGDLRGVSLYIDKCDILYKRFEMVTEYPEDLKHCYDEIISISETWSRLINSNVHRYLHIE
jgi:hypothetical protein